MRLEETRIPGVLLIELEPVSDERGFFARTYCAREFAARGLNSRLSQCATAFNPRAGTLRGLHYQLPPHAEAKTVRATRGSIYDVVVDLRPSSATLHAWIAIELSADNRRLVYVPEGCAHGYLTLSADAEVFYQISTAYEPQLARGVRYDDPALGIHWPREVAVVSDRDRTFPLISVPARSQAC